MESKRVKLTKGFLDSVPNPAEGTTRIADTELPGFGVDIGKAKTTFFVRRSVAGKVTRLKVGEYPLITLQQARERGRVLLAQMSLGQVPKPKLKKDETPNPTLSEALAEYEKVRTTSGDRIAPRTMEDIKERLNLHILDWMALPITEIDRNMVAKRHRDLTLAGKETTANRVMKYLSMILTWADTYYGSATKNLLVLHPVKALDKSVWNAESRRQTALDGKKFQKIWTAIDSISSQRKRRDGYADNVSDFFRFLAYTGMRPGEAARLETKRIDMKERVFLLKDAKNGTDFKLPLSTPLIELLARRLDYAERCSSDFVFPSNGRGKSKTVSWAENLAILKAAVPGFMLTDFRRTLVTVCNHMDPPLGAMTIKRLLNHTTGKVGSDVTSGYFVTVPEWLRKDVERVADRITQLATGKAVS